MRMTGQSMRFLVLGCPLAAGGARRRRPRASGADNPLTYWRFNSDLQDAQGRLNSIRGLPEFVAGRTRQPGHSSSEGKVWALPSSDILSGVQGLPRWINLKGDNEGKYILQRYAGEPGV